MNSPENFPFQDNVLQNPLGLLKGTFSANPVELDEIFDKVTEALARETEVDRYLLKHKDVTPIFVDALIAQKGIDSSRRQELIDFLGLKVTACIKAEKKMSDLLFASVEDEFNSKVADLSYEEKNLTSNNVGVGSKAVFASPEKKILKTYSNGRKGGIEASLGEDDD